METTNKQHRINLLNAAIDLGFEPDENKELWQIFEDAMDYIEENGEAVFTQCDFSCRGQYYTFCDIDGYCNDCTGDIFDFSARYEARHGKYFQMKDGEWVPVDWFDINDDNRRDTIFVFDKVPCSDGTVAWLYDYLQ